MKIIFYVPENKMVFSKESTNAVMGISLVFVFFFLLLVGVVVTGVVYENGANDDVGLTSNPLMTNTDYVITNINNSLENCWTGMGGYGQNLLKNSDFQVIINAGTCPDNTYSESQMSAFVFRFFLVDSNGSVDYVTKSKLDQNQEVVLGIPRPAQLPISTESVLDVYSSVQSTYNNNIQLTGAELGPLTRSLDSVFVGRVCNCGRATRNFVDRLLGFRLYSKSGNIMEFNACRTQPTGCSFRDPKTNTVIHSTGSTLSILTEKTSALMELTLVAYPLEEFLETEFV